MPDYLKLASCSKAALFALKVLRVFEDLILAVGTYIWSKAMQFFSPHNWCSLVLFICQVLNWYMVKCVGVKTKFLEVQGLEVALLTGNPFDRVGTRIGYQGHLEIK